MQDTKIEQAKKNKMLIKDNQNNFQIINKNTNELNKKSENNNKNDNDFTKDEKNKSNNSFWLIQSNKYNFYEIFKKYEHIPLKNYFLFKNLIIGQGKYGTVWFSIDVNKSNLIAIKTILLIPQYQDIMKIGEKWNFFEILWQNWINW